MPISSGGAGEIERERPARQRDHARAGPAHATSANGSLFAGCVGAGSEDAPSDPACEGKCDGAAVLPKVKRAAGEAADGFMVHPFCTERSLHEVTLGLPRIGEKVREQIPTILAMRSRMVSRRRRRRAPFIEAMVARRFLFGDDMRLRDHALTVEGIINTPAASLCGFFDDIMRHNRVEGLSALADLPVHVMVGDKDRLTPPSHAELLAEKVPGATLTVAPGAGHMLPLECDALVTEALVELVEQAQATRGRRTDVEEPGTDRLAAR